MRSFGKIVEIKENTPGIWYARYTHTDGADVQSDWVKFKQDTQPSIAQAQTMALVAIFNMNNPVLPPALIPDIAPQIDALTSGQQITLNLIWAFIKVWLRQKIGRN